MRSATCIGVLVTLGLAAALVSAAHARTSGTQPNTAVHYYYFDEPVFLSVDHARIAVRTDGTAPQRSLTTTDVASVKDTAAVPFGLSNWYTLELQPDPQRTTTDLSATTDQLLQDPTVQFVSPVLIDDHNLPVLITEDIIVRFASHVSLGEAVGIIAAANIGEIVETNYGDMDNTYRVRAAMRDGMAVLNAANQLALRPDTIYAEPDKVITGRLDLSPNDPGFVSGATWGVHNFGQSGGSIDIDLDGPEAWNVTTGDPNIIVAVFDLGTQQDHPDLNQVPGFDATGNGTGGGPLNYCDNHGTQVAGVISAIINNSIGSVGIAPDCKVAGVKIGVASTPCSVFFTAQDSYLVSGLSWSQNNGVDVTNASFGWGASSSITTKYNSTRLFGIVHFASSGNDGQGFVNFPASLDSVNAIGAINRNGTLAGFSNYGSDLAFTAPGVDVYTTDRTGSAGDTFGDYIWVDGTSFASPFAAGVAALLLALDPTLSPDQVELALQLGAKDLGAPGYDQLYGHGLPSAADSLGEIVSLPGGFNLEAPADGATAVDVLPAFNWSDAVDASDYTLYLDTTPSFDSAELSIITDLVVSHHTWVGEELREGVDYYWKVEANNLAGTVLATPGVASFTTFRDCDGNGLDDAAEIAADPNLDCNENDVLDACDLDPNFQVMTPPLSPLGFGTTQSLVLDNPPDANSNVTLTFTGFGDINGSNETVDVLLNGNVEATIFSNGIFFSCIPDQVDVVTVPAATWNTLAASGQIAIDMVPNSSVNGTQCDTDTFIQLEVDYQAVTTSQDLNGNGIPDECEAPPTGACCAPDGSCAITEEAACSGTWQGVGTTCDPNPCPQPTGACCAPDGSCIVVEEAACSGTWQGADTTCSPNPCPQPTGACCLPDGSCSITEEADCAGTWQGIGTTCDPNPCPQPTGACCQFGPYSCSVLTAADCANTGGYYQGDGTACDPLPCLCFGDLDCDGDIDFDDITPFVVSIGDDGTSWAAWYLNSSGSSPPCDFLNADGDGDGDCDFDDITPFVEAIGGTCP